MTLRSRTSLLALALIGSAAMPAPSLAQSAQDFQLPPNPTPTASPRVQGPVDEEAGPVPVRPRAIPTATPTPRVTAPQPTPAATPTAAPAAPRVVATPGQVAPAQTRPGQPAPPVASPIAPRETPPIDPAATPTALPPIGATPPPAITAPAPLPVEAADDDGTRAWPWLLAIAVGAALAAGGFALWRRRRDAAPPPVIEPPLARSPATAPPAAKGQALSLRAEAVKLTRSFAYATLDYRLTLINRTGHALNDLAVAADLVSAHGQAPMEQQVALPGTELPVQHALARLAPGQSQQLKGQVRLPIGEAQVIRQGRLPLWVPLLRVRVDGAGEDALARTFVIGQGVPDGGRLQPFRLDEPPRSYQPIAQRALD